MATLSRAVAALVIFLTFCFILDSNNQYKENSFSLVILALKSELKHYPSRGQLTGSSHKYLTTTQVPPSWKLRAGVRLLNTAMTASLVIILAGDISSNPGPSKFNINNFSRKRGFKFAHLNAQSIVNKIDEIRLLLCDKAFQVFAVSESWLVSSILDSEVSVPGYTLIRNDRKARQGGGTAIYVKDGIPFKYHVDLSSGNFETLWTEIAHPMCKKQFVCCLYRAQDCPTDSLLEDLNNSVERIPDEAELTILGDFNINVAAKKGSSDFYLKRKLFNIADLHSLEQLIKSPTRITDSSETTIDQILVNNNHRIVYSGVVQCTISYHSLVYCTVKAGVSRAVPRIIEHRSYKNYDKDVFIHSLNEIHWDLVNKESNVETAIKIFHSRERFSWITPDLKQAMRDRDFHHSKAIKIKSSYHWKMYTKLRLYSNKQVPKCKSDYYQDHILKNKGNPTKLWKTLNDVTGRKNTPNVTCIVANNVTYTEPIAETLNLFFTSIGSTLAAKLMPTVSQSSQTAVQEPEHQFVFQPITNLCSEST